MVSGAEWSIFASRVEKRALLVVLTVGAGVLPLEGGDDRFELLGRETKRHACYREIVRMLDLELLEIGSKLKP